MQTRPIRHAVTATLLCLTVAAPAPAHEVPARVTVLAFVRPEGSVLRVLLRVPLEAMRDINFPLRGQGYLDLARAEPYLREAAATWLAGALEVEENGRPLAPGQVRAVRVALPSDRSFVSYDRALAHLEGSGLAADTELVWQQAVLDVALDFPISSDRARFTVRPAFARLGLRTQTAMRVLLPGGEERALSFEGDPGRLDLDPGPLQAAFRFVRLGFLHILDGLDHLLFLLCLVIPVRRLRPLVVIVTSFTVAHSVTLVAAAMGVAPAGLWFPPFIETLIALSILVLAFENIVGVGQRRRWLLAFGFGLVHGFGFSFFLRDSLQFGGSHLAASLLSFNVGVELGQLLVVALALPLLGLLYRWVPERAAVIVLSALVAHSAWHWMTERFTALREYEIAWPAVDAVLLPSVARALLLLTVVGAAGWLMLGLARRLDASAVPGAAKAPVEVDP